MRKVSAGILLYKREGEKTLVLLVHPGGPIWGKRDSWAIPKGEPNESEDLLTTAKREFSEETGFALPAAELIDLGLSIQSSAKENHIWAIEGDADINNFSCNFFTMEWPPRSGKTQSFPECDKAEWFELSEARNKLFESLKVFIDRLEDHLKVK